MKKLEKHIMMMAALAVLLSVPAAALAQAEAYIPTVRVLFPNASPNEATLVPSTVTLNFSGSDPDGDTGIPTKIRFLLKFGLAQDGTEIRTRYDYESHFVDLIPFDDPEWSEWIPYSADPDQRRITFPSMPDQEYFLFACQAMDTMGAVSLGREYGVEVFNFQVRANYFAPQVVLNELYLGTTTTNQENEIAAGQPLNFSWIASADSYGGTIASYRHGFDLVDPDDPNDPGWAVPPGTEPQNLYATERSFQSGYHTFTLKVVDDSDQVTILTWYLNVIPFLPPEYQYPLLLIDQVVDDQSNQWLGQGGGIAYDREDYRNAYWHFLDGAGGVVNFNWDQDRIDHTEQVRYSDLVQYRSVLIYARNNTSQLMFNEFRPMNGQDKFVWLAPYQAAGGNLFLVGAQSQESFLEALPNYMVPIIFDSQEEYFLLNGDTYVVGFGTTTMPDGTLVERGPRQYTYATSGASALDWSVPLNKYIYGRYYLAHQDRSSTCAGIKGLVLDPDFRDNHQMGPGAIADTIGTNSDIDWRDLVNDAADTLANQFPFYGDEFVNFNISSRPTPIIEQECADGPGGLCVEPMFSGIARYDWLRERKWAEGDADWPYSEYPPGYLEDVCGELALASFDGLPDGTSRTNGLTYGYMSYKNVEDKPSGKADVYWGFDPYRFDHAQTKEAIRWVLDYFGLELYP